MRYSPQPMPLPRDGVRTQVHCQKDNCKFNGTMCQKLGITLDENGKCMDFQQVDCCGTCRYRVGGICEKLPWGTVMVGADAHACYHYEAK